jgi:hypothetical protein
MKKSIVASIIGVVATVAAIESSYGQGSVFFNNYGATTDAIITWTPLDPGGSGPAGVAFKATLLYQFGGGSLTALGNSTGINPAIPGYFTGPIVTIPGYVSGPISFQIQAYDGADYATSIHRGQSSLFTLANGIATGANPVGEFGPALTPFQVSTVPEPSTLALIGLGTGALLFLRRRK